LAAYGLLLLTVSACWFGAGTSEVVVAGRPQQSPQGSTFVKKTFTMSESEREEAIYQAVTSGNIPKFLRQLKPVVVRGKSLSGKSLSGTIYVMPDYLAIGSEQDFVRMPMNPITAQRIANHMGMFLPTTKIVDDIYRNADVKMSPAPLPPGKQMTTSAYYYKHNQKVEGQRRGKLGALTAGHKKDVVITNQLDRRPGRVAIYGWHRTSGIPIQPLSLVHHDKYADYSHGIRLIGSVMKIGGKDHKVYDVMQNPELAPLLSSEGAIRSPRIRIPMRSASL